jgi:hypothetical protein
MEDDAGLDYFATVRLLNGWAGDTVIVTPAPHLPEGVVATERDLGIGALSVQGVFKPLPDDAAGLRRELSDVYETIAPDLALGGDAPLEMYERQVAYYTFEGMDDYEGSSVHLALWEHMFGEARDLGLAGGPYEWLWIRQDPVSLYLLHQV